MPVSAPAKQTVGRTRRNEGLGTFAERFPILFESAGRLHKAAKITAVLRHFLGGALDESSILEVGASTGIMAAEFARVCRRVVAFDVDAVALRAGAHRAGDDPEIADKMTFLVGDGCNMPVADDSIDIVICNQVYEHVDDHEQLMNEIFRALRPGGVCYFGIGTRHVIIEGHYKLPFLSWLPPRLADLYVKLRGRELEYDVTLLSYRQLRKLVRRFSVFDYTVEIIKRPQAYAAGDVMRKLQLLSSLPFGFYRRLRWGLPVHVWVLQKPPVGETPRSVIIGS
jgi:SAM-dependent methyltransferase